VFSAEGSAFAKRCIKVIKILLHGRGGRGIQKAWRDNRDTYRILVWQPKGKKSFRK
jgi:hypothetical protein